MAIALAFFSAQAASALYVRANTEAASDAMLRGTPLGQILVWSLLNFNNPNSTDLTHPSVSHDVYITRLRDYANQRLISDFASLFVLGLAGLAWRRWASEL